MHESSMIGNLLEKIEEIVREAEARTVTRVRVRIGALAGISPGHFREHWELETGGTIADGATLEVETIADPGDPLAQQVILESIDVDD